jgi:hypothetical protein
MYQARRKHMEGLSQQLFHRSLGWRPSLDNWKFMNNAATSFVLAVASDVARTSGEVADGVAS